MAFEWDEKKRKANLKRHGFDFQNAEKVFESETTTLANDRFDYGEIRFVSFGMLQDLVVAVVYTETDESTRIIPPKGDTK